MILMRWMYLFSIVLVAFMSGCRGRSGQQDRDRIELGQNVTVSSKPLDPVFKDFPQTWPQFVSKNPELAAPVTGEAPKQEPTSPQPIIVADCVYSPDAQGYVPQVSLSWDELSGPAAETPVIAARRLERGTERREIARERQENQEKAAERQEETAVRRFDLGLHHDPFGRNLFSSVLSSERLQRFNLPPNSALVNNQEAVLLTGPGLFPKLMDYRATVVRDTDTNRQFLKQTVVLRELSEGISNTMRVSHRVGRDWNTDQQFVFSVPVCPSRF
jgi:hypothetical protein